MLNIIKKITAAVAALTVISTITFPAHAANTSVITFPLPADRNYQVSVLGKYSWGEYHRSYTSADIYKTGAGGDSYCLMDIAAPRYTPIYAVADGMIYNNKKDTNGGNKVVIKHDDGSYSYYGHMEYKTKYSIGDRVNSGDLLGYVGSAAHLHFEWSGHDVFCEFKEMGYNISIMNNSGASTYPHNHSSFYYAVAKGTDGSLAINQRAQSGCKIGNIPEGAVCKVYPDRSYKNWLYVEYNGVYGFSYKNYLIKTVAPITENATHYVKGTDGELAINSRPKAGYKIGVIPEGASCTVYSEKSSGNWLWVEYNGISGYSYNKYLVPLSSSAENNVATGIISGTNGSLAINQTASTKYRIGIIPEGASCKVYTNNRIGNWVYVEYNGISGYAYKKYIIC